MQVKEMSTLCAIALKRASAGAQGIAETIPAGKDATRALADQDLCSSSECGQTAGRS